IDAIDNNYVSTPVNGRDGTGSTPLASVLGNDLLNGVILTSADVTLTTPLGSPHAGISMITTGADKGEIVVAAGTPAGTYHYSYRICEVLNLANCDDAVATILVTAAPIDAVVDNAYPTVNGKTGT